MSLMTRPAVSSIADRAYASNSHAPWAARRFVKSQLLIWGMSYLTDTAELVVSELVSNAYMHAQGNIIGVRLECADGSVMIRVMDEAPNKPPRMPDSNADDIEECGRGLALVAGIAKHWAWYPTTDGHKVLCALITKPAL